jgi:hypothetical protein
MKNILSALIAVTAVAGFASAASAQSSTATFNGTVNGVCTITASGATFPTATTLTPSITSATGTIKTKCNTPAASLTVALDTHTAADSPSTGTPATALQTVTRFYELSGGTNAYSGLIVAPAYTSTAQTLSNINHANSTADSVLNLTAKIDAPTNENLAAGSYITRVIATITP